MKVLPIGECSSDFMTKAFTTFSLLLFLLLLAHVHNDGVYRYGMEM